MAYTPSPSLPHPTGLGRRGTAMRGGVGLLMKSLLGLLVLVVIAYWMLEESVVNVKDPFRSLKEMVYHSCSPPAGLPAKQYALVIDAGSTGSRIHVYRFNHCDGPSLTLEDEIFQQLKPGLSSPKFATPEEAANSLDPLLKIALEAVPANVQKCTPVTVKATAGLRMLKDGKGEQILKAVKTKLQTEYPFALIEPDSVAIMAGKDEGVFAWITVNYLLKRIGQKDRKETAAIMDLGGGSTQIVFEPHPSTPMEPGDHKYELQFGDHKSKATEASRCCR
ncbi:uncharacterized protein SPPG_03996 [Spizellomyces punctatus DAOM BR117]|uniref:guanosine-diphosphatase n=1 Tax=Spizellomyces punctatus (strain DAOM BR117) TaxID=645134 RepID=A0A0L0HHG4_SPIPD|nr:uncharacterized protein SPPG_03996 [Spizellomyces punctatus DAOM BR117]KND00896.1 hypothetical protein SPPG_03996 [Spizellomyces punctatus DAOM BR117]|eukprot:XP_016608935.1 hypothetical protein SPPG_03996 [Spizellomyces punctatus DAOM BR117]